MMVSHSMEDVARLTDRLLVMKDGKVTKEIRRDEDFTEQSVIGEMI